MGALSSVLLIFLVIGVPIGIALAGATGVMVLFSDLLTISALFESFFSFLTKYTLIAIPLFIYAGFLMEKTGLVGGLFRFADSLVGWIPGGFAYATLVVAVIFGAISGSSTAMAAALSVIAYPELIKRGYPVWMSAGLIASAGGIALLIPPSVTLILFGILTETSIIELFFAGMIPGLMLAMSDAAIILGVSLFIKLPRKKFDIKEVGRTLLEAYPGILMPVIVLGGLYGGLFTPTEAGAAACAYAMLYGMIAKRREFIKELGPTTLRTLNLTAIVVVTLYANDLGTVKGDGGATAFADGGVNVNDATTAKQLCAPGD